MVDKANFAPPEPPPVQTQLPAPLQQLHSCFTTAQEVLGLPFEVTVEGHEAKEQRPAKRMKSNAAGAVPEVSWQSLYSTMSSQPATTDMQDSIRSSRCSGLYLSNSMKDSSDCF